MRQTKQLFLMRHGQAGPPQQGNGDKSRRLDGRGRQEVLEVAERLCGAEKAPDCALVSTAMRTLETFEILAGLWAPCLPSIESDRLYLAELDVYFDLFSEVPLGVKRLLIIAHNPGLSELVQLFLGGSQILRTSSIFRIDLDVPEFVELGRSPTARLGAIY